MKINEANNFYKTIYADVIEIKYWGLSNSIDNQIDGNFWYYMNTKIWAELAKNPISLIMTELNNEN